jgi:hypothetical protein
VQPRPRHLVQAAVGAPLHQPVAEAVLRQALPCRLYPIQANCPHQPVPVPQRAAQAAYNGLLTPAQHPCSHLGGEPFALYGGSLEQRPVLLRQGGQVPGDHRLYLRWPALPIEGGRFHPVPGLIPHQRPLALKAAQQLDGEQRIAPRVLVQCLPKRRAQAIRLAVDVCFDESSPIGLIQVDQDISPLAAKFAEDGPHARRFCSLPHPGLERLRPAGAGQQDAAARQAPAQVKEQRRRAAVGPLQIVDRQQQGPSQGDGAQHLGQLGEQVAL